MTSKVSPSSPVSRPRPIILAAAYFFYLTIVLRTLAETNALGSWLRVYIGLELMFGALFTFVLLRPIRRVIWQQFYFIFQSLIALFLLYLHPRLDFTNIIFVLLSFQAAVVFSGRMRWFWVAFQIVLIILSLTVFLGSYGMALALLPAAVAIVFSAYVGITQEIEAGQLKREALLAELQGANRQLTTYAGQVEELSALQERDRLARELHDSVSQTMFSIGLNSRAARILLECQPERLRPQLEELQALTQDALKEMRSLIADLRPRENGNSQQPTP